MTPRFANKRALFDDRKFNFGEVWLVDDNLINMPHVDHIGARRSHQDRWVVVISNNVENVHPLCPIVTVAPLSHRVELMKEHDLLLESSEDNVNCDCLLQIKLTQPVIKKDLRDCKGPISEDKKVELQVLLEDFYGLHDDEE